MMDEGIIFAYVPDEFVPSVWPKVEGFIDGAVKTANGKCRSSDILDGINSGVYLLWVVVEGDDILAAVTTRIIEYPQRRALALDWVGGTRMKDWIALVISTAEEHARNNGCQHLEGYGRPAWMRFLQRYGWKQEYVAYRLEV